MAISQEKIEGIALQVIKVLYTRFESFPENSNANRNAPFHEAFLNAFSDKLHGKVSDIPFFVTLSSWFHGLNTTLGQTFFEKVGQILSDSEKREYTSKKLGNLKITKSQKDSVNEIITSLSTSEQVPNLNNEDKKIFIRKRGNLVNAIDFSADIFIKEKSKIIAVELKSVRPNSGEMRGEKQKILEGKAALYREFPGDNIRFIVGFPFDPTNDPSSPTGYNKKRLMSSIINMNKYFSEEEVLVANELWNFLSDEEHTMEQLLEIINAIATPEFLDRYKFLEDPKNKEKNIELYKQRLKDWHLYSELRLVSNEENLLKEVAGNRKLEKAFMHLIFKEGEYNVDRFNKLVSILN
ncbi:MAG: TdeIII family type II restriction endonuclease [Ignavibacteriae bacterium]|nr:TdeIII family type II restriction endonuclease [Ignavibacteriota bacterium]